MLICYNFLFLSISLFFIKNAIKFVKINFFRNADLEINLNNDDLNEILNFNEKNQSFDKKESFQKIIYENKICQLPKLQNI